MSCSRPAVYGRRSYVVQLTRTTLAMAELKSCSKTELSASCLSCSHLLHDRQLKMSKTPGEYKYH